MHESQTTVPQFFARSHLALQADRLTFVTQFRPDPGPDSGAGDSAQEAQEPGEGAR